MIEYCPSGIVLPKDEWLEAEEVIPGLFVVKNAYQVDLGYFAQSPIYKRQKNEEMQPDKEGGRE